jgi:hypothetical protein
MCVKPNAAWPWQPSRWHRDGGSLSAHQHRRILRGASAMFPDLTTNDAPGLGRGSEHQMELSKSSGLPRVYNRPKPTRVQRSQASTPRYRGLLRRQNSRWRSMERNSIGDRPWPMRRFRAKCVRSRPRAVSRPCSTKLELLTTAESLITMDASVAPSDAALIQDKIALFKALGGGWRQIHLGGSAGSGGIPSALGE